MKEFWGRVGIQQRKVPHYRLPFFDGLARRCQGGLQLFHGDPLPSEGVGGGAAPLQVATAVHAHNVYLGRGRSHLCWQRGLFRWLRAWAPDVLIVEANPRILSTYFTVPFMKARRRPVVGWGLGYLDRPTAGWLVKLRMLVLGWFYRRFDVLIAYSSKGAADYVGLRIPPERVFVAHNAVSAEDSEQLSQDLERGSTLLAEWKAQRGLSNKPLLLFVGRLIAAKRVDCLIHAGAALADRCELLIVGEGPERQLLQALAQQVFPRAKFLGHQSGRDLALSFAAADLFVLPGRGGLAVQEAMQYGNAVVVAEADGTQRDLVHEGRNGYLVPAGDVAALTRAIERCLTDPEQLRRMGEESRRITERVNLDAMIDSFTDVLNEIAVRKADAFSPFAATGNE